LGRQLRLPEFQPQQPTGGEVETGRGKKTKKIGWHLTLGIKETIFVGIGVAGLMMMSFALGALAGRGDIYRAASNWGLLSPEGPKVAQWTPPTGVTGGPSATGLDPAASTGLEAATAPTQPAVAAAAPAVAPIPQAKAPAPVAAAKPAHPAPVTASITPLSPPIPAASAPAAAKKKGKTGAAHHDLKAREEELKQLRQEVVKKLKFQNSFDTAPKARLPKSKEHEKAQAQAAKAQPTVVRVGQYKTSKAAEAKVAELQKKGVKATVRKSKDARGTIYVVCKPGSATTPKKPAE
jgi:hypothetical protein